MADKRSRKRKAYTTKQVQLIGSHALQEMERILLSDCKNDEKIRAANAISTLMNSYRALVETSELVERIEKLEEKHLRKVS
ncbi:MAG TPA: hypothetical protein VK040_00690 [Balneolaceae bacterium]|nr:hypothetical protein [Balneolaceae bacterium]